MILGQTDYREILKNVMNERKAFNPNYSLRAFSRDLGVSPSRLSQVLKGSYGFSPKAAKEIVLKLNFNEEESRYFCDLVAASHAKNDKNRAASQKRIEEIRNTSLKYTQLNFEYFKVISEDPRFDSS